MQDCHMPLMDGLEATRRIREEEEAKLLEQQVGVRVKVVVAAVTASAFDFEREACFRAGMDQFLTKPIRKAEIEGLLRLTREHCGRST